MKHLLAKYTNEELYSLLEAEVVNGKINKFHDEGTSLVGYSYDRSCMIESYWNDATMIARGIVIDEDTKEIVALPFCKFFNLSERGGVIPDEEFEVFEKADGSLGIIFSYKGEWRVNTRGSFKSDQAIWAKKYFDENSIKSNLDDDCTYLAEIVFHDNRIVIDYQFEGLVLLGGYNNISFEELDLKEVASHFNVPNTTNIKVAETHEGKSIDDLIYLAENVLTENEEGFVVRFLNGHRVKIKGARYCHLHKILSDFSEKRVMEYVRDTPNVNVFEEDFFNSMPEEFQIDFYTYYNKYELLFNSIVADAMKFISQNKLASCRDVGIMQKEKKVSNTSAKLFFLVKNGKFKSLYSKSKERNSLFKIINDSLARNNDAIS